MLFSRASSVSTPVFPIRTMNANASGTPEKFDVIFSSIVNAFCTRGVASVAKRAPMNATMMPTIAEISEILTLLMIAC